MARSATPQNRFGYPEGFELSKGKTERQKKLQKQYQNLMVSIILTPDIHELLKQYCLDQGLTYPEGVRSAVSHAMKCGYRVE
jgi:hypothetical protein